MIKRYFNSLASNRYTFFASNVEASHTAQTITFTTVIQGYPSANVTFKVTTYAASDPGAANYEVNGTSYHLNDTFVLVLDSTGSLTITQFLDVGTSTSGNALNIALTIFSVDKGLIGSPSVQGNEYVV